MFLTSPPVLRVKFGERTLRRVSWPQRHRASDDVPFPIRANGFTSTAPAYQTFLAQTLKPLIDAQFRTRPEVWGTCGAFSPSLWVQDFALLDFAQARPAPELRLYVDRGTCEGVLAKDAVAAAGEARWFAVRSAPHVAEVNLQIAEGHWHDESAWRERLPGFMRWWLGGSADHS